MRPKDGASSIQCERRTQRRRLIPERFAKGTLGVDDIMAVEFEMEILDAIETDLIME